MNTPTRPASGKTLDLLLSTYPNSVSNVFMSSGWCNHLALIFEINLKPLRSTKPPHKAYIYKKANFDGLSDFILSHHQNVLLRIHVLAGMLTLHRFL